MRLVCLAAHQLFRSAILAKRNGRQLFCAGNYYNSNLFCLRRTWIEDQRLHTVIYLTKLPWPLTTLRKLEIIWLKLYKTVLI